MNFKSKAWMGWIISGVVLVGVLITAVLASEGIAAGMRSGSGPITALSLKESVDQVTWAPVIGGLAEGYSLTLDGVPNTYKYLDVDNLTATPNLANGRYEFYFDHLRVPDGYFTTYWAGKGVVAGATGWQGVMWEIINGRQPMFYLDVSESGSEFALVDGLMYQYFGTTEALQVSQDYPLATYHFGGYVTDPADVNSYVNVQITFTKPATASLRIDSEDWVIDGCGYLDVYIRLADVHDLYAVDFELSFNPDVLEVVDLLPGDGVNLQPIKDLISEEPETYFFDAGYVAINQADNALGTIRYVATQTNTTEPAQGEGDVAMIRFRTKAISLGTPITITKVELSDRDGFLVGREVDFEHAEITTTFSSAAGLNLDIIRLNASTVQLQWPKPAESSGIDGFILHKSTLPYFLIGDTSVDAITTGFNNVADPITYDDAVLGNVVNNYFYALQVTCEHDFNAVSHQVGKFEYELYETTGTNFSWVGLVLEVDPSLDKAAKLANHIEANSSGSVTVQTISRWNPAAQNFTPFIKMLGITNFDTIIKNAYRIEVDIPSTNQGSVIWAQVGKLPVITENTYTLYETTGTDFNWILQPLHMTTVNTASALRTHIQTNASGPVSVVTIARWNGSAQNFTPFVSQIGITNFTTRFGYPYRIEVDVESGSTVTWP